MSRSTYSQHRRALRPLTGIVLDFDGTIIDTEGPWRRAWQRIFRERGVSIDIAEWVTMTRSRRSLLTEYKTRTGTALSKKTLDWQMKQALAEIRRAPEQAGVRELLLAARRAGIPVALATDADRRWLDAVMPKDIAAMFDYVITYDDTGRCKPWPDIHTRAVDALGVDPNGVVLIEDSGAGAVGALRATAGTSARVVLVSNELNLHYDVPGVMRVESLVGLVAERDGRLFVDWPSVGGTLSAAVERPAYLNLVSPHDAQSASFSLAGLSLPVLATTL